MPASETVIIELRMAGLQQFRAESALASASVRDLGDTSKKQAREPGKMAGAMGMLGTAAKGAAVGGVAAVGTAMAAGTYAGLKFNSEMENAQTRFRLFTRNAKEARDVVQNVNDVASKSTFARTELSNAAALMGVAGIRGDRLTKSLQAAANAASAAGAGSFGLERMAQVLQQMQSTGKVTGEDMQQIANMGLPAFKILADQLGITEKALRTKIRDGGLKAREGINALTEGFTSGKMAKAAQDQANTVSGQMSNLVGRTTRTLGTLTAPLFNWIKKSILPVLTEVSRGIAEWADAGGLQKVGKALGVLSPIFDAVAEAAKAWFWAVKPLFPYFKYLLPVLKILGLVVGVLLVAGFKQLAIQFRIYGRLIRIMVGAIKWAVQAFKDMIRWVRGAWSWLKRLAGVITGAVVGAWRAMIRWVNNAGHNMERFGRSVIASVVKAFNTVVNKIKGAGRTIASAVGDVFRSAVNAGKKLLDGFLNLGKSIVKAIADGIKASPGAILDAIKGIVDESLPGKLAGKVSSALGFQHGGTIPPNSGFQIVGERGPELVSFRPGTRVTPMLSSTLPSMPALGGAGGGGETIKVPVYLDGRQITEAVADRVRSKRARS